MVRALSVFLAAAWLALAPAAFAATEHKKPAHKTEAKAAAHKASAKAPAKAKSGDDEAPSARAKLRRSADAAPAGKSKRHGGATKAVSTKGTSAKTSKTHDKGGDEEAVADKPAGNGKADHAAAKEEDVKPPTPAKSCRKVHGKAVKCKPRAEPADTEVAAAETKTARHHGKAVEAAAEEPVHTTHHYPVVETPTIRRAEEHAEGACAAARDAKGRHRRSAKARASAYRSCVAKAQAAARRAAEEEAARVASWTPTKGPILYAGPMAHSATGPIPYAAPTNPPADHDAPGTATPAAGAVPPSSSRPASGGGFLGLFQRKPERPNGPAPTLAGLLGADETRLRAELGDPDLMRAEGGGALWTYRLQTCAVYVFLSRPQPSAPWQVKGAQAGPLKRGQATPDLDGCLKAGRP